MTGPHAPMCKGGCGYVPASHIPDDPVFTYVVMGGIALFWLALFVWMLIDCWGSESE